MSPIWGSVSSRADSFNSDLDQLRPEYPLIDECVEELEEFLKLDYVIPEILVDRDTPNVYATKLDYPPLGSAGKSLFLVTYHATDPNPSPRTPYRTFTFLSITERTRKGSGG